MDNPPHPPPTKIGGALLLSPTPRLSSANGVVLRLKLFQNGCACKTVLQMRLWEFRSPNWNSNITNLGIIGTHRESLEGPGV